LHDERSVEAMGGVISCIGETAFPQDALAQLNRWLPVAWWSVYRLFDDKPPTLHASAAYHVPDGTRDSFQVYRDGLYKADQTFLAARDHGAQQMLVHWHAREIPHPHRESIYSRHGLTERLSIVCRDADESLLAVNLYRHGEQPGFSDQEMADVGGAAGLLLSCVQRHVRLCSATPRNDAALGMLTRREREVCERMLKGISYDGIAADLGVSAGTIKTYRDRAFERLGIHHRNELFALVFGHIGAC
jgi:DNA-binding CsgD family transcriptional regulator